MRSAPQIRHANEILLDLNGVFPGDLSHQRFRWMWSSDLWDLVPVLDGNGEPKYCFFCQCGVDVQVHSALCNGITAAQMKFEKCMMVDDYGPLASYPNMWVLCRWVPPPAPEEWKAAMGTSADYPASGRYLPVSKNASAVVIPPRADPDEYAAISRIVVRMMRENIEKFHVEQQNKEIKRMLPRMDDKGNMIEEPHKDSPFWAARDRIRESRPRFDPTATVGAGGKTGLGHKGSSQIHRSSRSLVDQVARAVDKSNAQMKKELADAISK